MVVSAIELHGGEKLSEYGHITLKKREILSLLTDEDNPATNSELLWLFGVKNKVSIKSEAIDKKSSGFVATNLATLAHHEGLKIPKEVIRMDENIFGREKTRKTKGEKKPFTKLMMKMMEDMGHDYSIVIDQLKEYAAFLVHDAKKIIITTNGDGATYILNLDPENWPRILGRSINEIRSLQICSHQSLEIARTVDSRVPIEWQKSIKNMLSSPNPRTDIDDIEGRITTQKYEPAPPGFMQEHEMYNNFGINIYKLRRGIKEIAEARGFDDPRMISELWLNSANYLERYYPPDVVDDIREKFPEIEQEKLGEDWFNAHRMTNLLKAKGMIIAEQTVNKEAKRIAKNRLESYAENEGNDFDKAQHERIGRSRSVAEGVPYYSKDLAEIIIEEIRKMKAKEAPLEEDSITSSEIKDILWREHRIKIGHTRLSNLANQIIEERKDPDFKHTKKYVGKRHNSVPSFSAKLAQAIVDHQIEEFSKYEEPPKTWITFNDVWSGFIDEVGVNRDDTKMVRKFLRHINDILRRMALTKKGAPLQGKFKKDGEIKRLFAPEIIPLVRDKINFK